MNIISPKVAGLGAALFASVLAVVHPYTSGFGVCTEGASPAQGCHHPTGAPIPPSHYERAPFNQ